MLPLDYRARLLLVASYDMQEATAGGAVVLSLSKSISSLSIFLVKLQNLTKKITLAACSMPLLLKHRFTILLNSIIYPDLGHCRLYSIEDLQSQRKNELQFSTV